MADKPRTLPLYTETTFKLNSGVERGQSKVTLEIIVTRGELISGLKILT